jgi:CubicO group peptidase (beta-lactamase class C family)
MSAARSLDRLASFIRSEIDAGLYLGAVAIVARHGEVLLHEAIGTSRPKPSEPLRKDAVFSLFSTSKAFTNMLVYQAVERAAFRFTTRVAELIPEFAGHRRDAITIAHLMSHCSGLPPVLSPRPGMYIDTLSEVVAAICADIRPTNEPGSVVCYSPAIAHALLGEAVRRVDPLARSFREIAQAQIFAPLGLRDTSFGVRADLKPRHVVPLFPKTELPMEHPGRSNYGPNGAFEEEHAEMPWVGAVSTAHDVFRFAELLRRGGELDGVRIISPAMLRLVARNHTGDQVNLIYSRMRELKGWAPWPAYLGLGFQLRGEALCPHHFGTLASAGTFGHTGLGSSVFWVDPQSDTTFVCLTAGVMQESQNIERFERLSDLVHSSVS